MLDVVDTKDKVIDSLPRSKVYEGNRIIRGVWLFIENSKGQLWIPRRTRFKPIYPDSLEGSVVGHVSAGETYEETIKRETFEEVRINLDKIPYQEIGYLGPNYLASFGNNIQFFAKVYKLFSDEVPNYSEDDYSEFFWLTPEELLKKLEDGEKFKPSLALIVKKLLI